MTFRALRAKFHPPVKSHRRDLSPRCGAANSFRDVAGRADVVAKLGPHNCESGRGRKDAADCERSPIEPRSVFRGFILAPNIQGCSFDCGLPDQGEPGFRPTARSPERPAALLLNTKPSLRWHISSLLRTQFAQIDVARHSGRPKGNFARDRQRARLRPADKVGFANRRVRVS